MSLTQDQIDKIQALLQSDNSKDRNMGEQLVITLADIALDFRQFLKDIFEKEVPDIVDLTVLRLFFDGFTEERKNYFAVWALGMLAEQNESLAKMTTLYLRDSHLKELPDSLQNLSHLTILGLSYNKLTSLPDWIGTLDKLVYFYLRDNQLERLPDSIRNLTHLRYLHLQFNQLPRSERIRTDCLLPECIVYF